MPIFGALMGFSLLFGASPFHVGGASIQQPAEPIVRVTPSYTVAMTAYNAVPEQTDGNPFETASGAYSNHEIVAARSQDLAAELPFGTIIEIDGSSALATNTCGLDAVASHIGYRVVADTMNARYTDRVDILFESLGTAKTFGICKGITVRVVGHIDIKHIPKTQVALAALVNGTYEKLALK